MGLFHGRDLFSSKYITAEIKDASKRLHYVPIKHMIGDYFITKLDGQTYCFKMDNEICQYREKATKHFRVIQYDTTHYRPIKSEIKELELLLIKEDLPKVNNTMAEVFKVLSNKEKKQRKKDGEFIPHSLEDLINDLKEYKTLDISKVLPENEARFISKVKTIVNYLKDLDIEKISTPVKGISNFIEDDLKATDPQFLGTVGLTLQNLDFEDKKVTNTPLTSRQALMKVVIVIMLVVIIGALVAVGIEQGWFDSIADLGSGFASFTPGGGGSSFSSAGGAKNSAYYQNNFTPEELRAAIDRGEINEDTLPADIKEMVRNVEAPKVVPKTPGKDIVIGG